MALTTEQISRFLKSLHPYDALPQPAFDALLPRIETVEIAANAMVYELGTRLTGLFIIHQGKIEVRDQNNAIVSNLAFRNSFGERGLLRDGHAVTSARATEDAVLLIIPADVFHDLIKAHDIAFRFFDRSRTDRPQEKSLATTLVATLMAPNPITCPPGTTAQAAARLMLDRKISSLFIVQGDTLEGLITQSDLTGKILAQGLSPDTPVSQIMARDLLTLPPSAIGSDVLHTMMEHRVGHIPILEGGKLKGVVTQTDLTRFQSLSSAELVSEIAHAGTISTMADVTARIPQLLVQLVAGGNRHEIVTRLITDVADTVTRRLLAMAEDRFGPPPVPYLWAACGSQGRQEQTGVSDQDNCLILDDAVSPDQMPYFSELAKFVSDGLDACGYFYCPGDMMATNPRWCQPVRVWRDYFEGWIAKPNPEAQMLASVMFDLRPIGGDESLFAGLQMETLRAASRNSIFVAHMISNSLKHTPPLGLLRGFATIRSGEHRNTLDLKHNGVVPVVDLARIYALQGQLTEANTRARLAAAQGTGAISPSGARDLLDAYDLIAETRLNHQVALIKSGEKPDNFLAPTDLSDFERSHLRDAFVVVKTLQSALGHGKGMLN